MNNSDIPSQYRGEYIFSALARSFCKEIKVEEGTVLVSHIEGSHGYYFEIANDYLFTQASTDFILMTRGSVVDEEGISVDDNKNMTLPQIVRFPTLGELEWYERLKLI